jgi:GABA(A) receptor-associated protein
MSKPTETPEIDRIMKKYPGRIPVYVKRADNIGSKLPDINRHKFLIPQDFTLHALQHTVRLYLKLKPEQAIFLFINNTIPNYTDSLAELYEKNHDKDGLLYVTYSTENTFG